MKTNILIGALAITASLFAAPAADYKKCVSCHGVIGDKSALGKSKKLTDMSQDEITIALKGYKNGTYGGPMKGLMKGQVARYSEPELEAMASYIKSLHK